LEARLFMAGKTILILGGGIGGIVAANELRKLLSPEHRIVMIEKEAQHAFAPSFLWVMSGERKPRQIVRDIRQMVPHGVEVMVEQIEAIDLPNRILTTSSHTLPHDYLIVSLGAELAPEMIPGLTETAHTFYTFNGAIKLHDALRDFGGGAVAVVVGSVPYKCPGAPHEGAMLIADMLRRRGLEGKASVHLFTPEPQPMPVAGPSLGAAVREMLEATKIAFHPLHKLLSVDASHRELHFEGQSPFTYDLLVAIPPHRGHHIVRNAGLANEAGWIPVDRKTLATRHERVYAIGDATAVQIPGRWKPDVPMLLPKAGVFAHAQAQAVAHNIAAEIGGSAGRVDFLGEGYCVLECGEGRAGFAFGDFFAEPNPKIELRQPGRRWHLGKILFEQYWLAGGVRREALRIVGNLGARASGVPALLR
jgi:sulfide:quinone oxidoreductase